MTSLEHWDELNNRLLKEGVSISHRRVGREMTEYKDGLTRQFKLTLDGRPFAAWSEGGVPKVISNVVWYFDEIGQPDLSFKGINKFKGRWEPKS